MSASQSIAGPSALAGAPTYTSVRLQVDTIATSSTGSRRERNAFSVVASCCGASAKRPRRSSGAVVWLSPRAKTLIGRL